MEHGATFLADLAIVLAVGAATSVVFRLLRQPVVMGYLLAGFIVGPYLPVPLFADVERIEALAEFGVVLVMFSVGLEFSLRKLMRVMPATGLPALIQMSTLAFLGVLTGRLLGWGDLESVFLGACLAISSTMIVVRALDEVEVPADSRQLALGILVSQDVVAILLIAGLTAAVSGGGMTAGELVARGGELLLFLAGLLIVGLLVVPRLVRRLVRLRSPEMLVVATTGFCFGLALLAERMGYSVALGAFVAGSLVAESGLAKRVEPLIRPVRDLFAAVFFVAIGMAVDPSQVVRQLPVGLLVAALIIVGQLVSVTLGGLVSGRSLGTSVRSGAALGQIGEFSFIIATLGVASGAVRPELYSIVVLAALATAFTTTNVLRGAEHVAVAIDRALPRPVRRLVCLYPSWLERVSRTARETLYRTRLRRQIQALVFDVLVLVALTIAMDLSHQRLGASLAHSFGFSELNGSRLVLLGAFVLAAPFVLGILRLAGAVGRELATTALPETGAGLDMATAPRETMVTLLQTAVLLAATLVYATATQPFLPGGWSSLPFLLTFVVVTFVLWRSTSNLDEHVRAGAQAFSEALMQPNHDPEFHDVEELLPGLGDLKAIEVSPACCAGNATLASLNLRGRTGATVLAVRRGDQVHSLPGGDWELRTGDLLGVTGSHEAVERARLLISTGEVAA